LTDLSILASAIRTLSKTLDKAERFLVLVNPCSGKKRGVIEYEKVLRPMLEQAGICHDCLITTHPNHAKERMQSQDFKDISEYTSLVLVGGDGIIHEVMQGIDQMGAAQLQQTQPDALLPSAQREQEKARQTTIARSKAETAKRYGGGAGFGGHSHDVCVQPAEHFQHRLVFGGVAVATRSAAGCNSSRGAGTDGG